MTAKVTSSLKRLLPAPIRRPLGKLRAVAVRLSLWRKVQKNLSGACLEDTKILTRSLRRAPITVWRDLHAWQFPTVESDCIVISKGVGRFTVRGRTDDLFHVLPGQEPAVEALVWECLREGDAFVDAGSNIGFYTILASRLVGSSGRVIACEMMPVTASILRSHVEMNGAANVAVFEGALAETGGEIVEAFFPEGKSGQSSLVRAGQGNSVMVQTLTLREVLADLSSVRLMKMDLEGAELGALRGLGTDIHKVETIVMENRHDAEPLALLEANGFKVSRLDGNNVIARRDAARQ